MLTMVLLTTAASEALTSVNIARIQQRLSGGTRARLLALQWAERALAHVESALEHGQLHSELFVDCIEQRSHLCRLSSADSLAAANGPDPWNSEHLSALLPGFDGPGQQARYRVEDITAARPANEPGESLARGYASPSSVLDARSLYRVSVQVSAPGVDPPVVLQSTYAVVASGR